MKDLKGYLPVHVGCSQRCSVKKLDMLLEAFPGSIDEKTKDGDTPLDLARKTATDEHPNEGLIDYLSKAKAKRQSDNETEEIPAAKKARLTHEI